MSKSKLLKVPKWKDFEETVSEIANNLTVSTKDLIHFVHENIENILESHQEVIKVSTENITTANNYRSIKLSIDIKSGKKEPIKLSCHFDVHYYRGYIEKLTRPDEGDENKLVDLANVKLVKIKQLYQRSSPKIIELVAQTDVRAT